jgi:hypothetical protein
MPAKKRYFCARATCFCNTKICPFEPLTSVFQEIYMGKIQTSIGQNWSPVLPRQVCKTEQIGCL